MGFENKNKSGGVKGSFVLMIGDEGATLTQIRKNKVVYRLFAPSPDSSHTIGFDEILRKNPNSPITMLVDMMDQSYVVQTLPPVSSLNVKKIVSRRLQKDFPPDDIKGYIVLGREKTGRRDWNYMMVSIASHATLQKWLEFALERENTFMGIGVVPLELQAFTTAIAKALNKNNFEWQILVSHNKVSGFRQVVLRNGKLIFTRMAQPFGDSQPDVIAGNIEQEMINTLEYLKRLGLQDIKNISATIIVAEDIKNFLDPKNIKVGDCNFSTPYEISNLLSLTDAAQVKDNFADIIISAFIAKQKKLVLPLHNSYSKNLSDLLLYIKLEKLVVALAVIGFLIFAAIMGSEIIDEQKRIDVLLREKDKLSQDLERAKNAKSELPKEINQYADITTLDSLFNKKQYDVLEFINNFAGTLENAALAKDLEWKISDPLRLDAKEDKRQIHLGIDLHLTTPTVPKEVYIAASSSLIYRINKKFPEFNVNNTELPGVISENQELKTTLDDSAVGKEEKLIDSVKVTIDGPSGKKVGDKK